MSVVSPSVALFDLLERRARHRRSFFRRRATLIVGCSLLVLAIVVTVGAPLITPYNPNEIDPLNPLAPPLSPGHPLGTDNFGRDILSRILYGGRIDLLIAFGATSVTLVVGTVIGLFSGYFGGWIDSTVMRIVDLIFAFPFFVLVIAIVAMLGPSVLNMFIAIWMTSWVSYTRITRGHTLVAKRHEYVLGAALGFLGLGAKPPSPEWGVMISDGQAYIFTQWWLATFPGIAIVIVGVGFSLIGDGLADVLRAGD
jgi:peptide/nickel transport system permease protein